jgi:hypothetical protein
MSFGINFGVGLGTGGGVLLPAAQSDIIQWLRGGSTDGVSLDYRVQTVASDAELRNVNCANFLTNSDRITVGTDDSWITTSGLFEINFWAKRDSTVSADRLYYSGNNSYFVQFNTGNNLQVVLWNSSGQQYINSLFALGIDSTEWHHYRVSGDGTAASVYVDFSGTPVSTSAYDGDFDGTAIAGSTTIGSTIFSLNGQMSNFSLGRLPADNIDLILLIGQSNAQGQTGVANPSYLDGQTHRFSYQVQGGVPIIAYDQNLERVGANIWGAELEAGYQITQNLSRQVAFVKVTKASTSMAVNWQKGGDMYTALETVYNTAIKDWLDKGYTPRLREVWLMQGESDTLLQANAEAWEANATQFKSDIEDDLGIKVPWVVGRINSTNPSWTYGETVKAQQDLFAANNSDVSVFSTDDVELISGDIAHYSSDGLIELGQLFVNNSYISKSTDASTFYSYLFPLEEGSGTTCYDVTPNNNDSVATGVGWTTSDAIPSWNHQHGFRVAVADTPPYIPALSDESLAADGNPITNPAGFVHNNSECSIVQTDSAVFGAGTVSFWSADGSTLDEKTKAQMDTHYNNTNGSYTLWIRKSGDNIYEAVQYPLDQDFTPAEVLRNEAYFGGTSGALRDGGGDLITDVNGFVVFTA